ncbi:MAG: ABC transporter permease [Clostridia bacterium]|nr:ABC transporter permease [Clostridia bacterium]
MLDRMFTSEALEEALWILKNEFPMAVWETIYVTVLATLFAIVIGLPLGVLLVAGEKNGVLPLPAPVMSVLNIVINLLRSVPFLILLMAVMPFTRAMVGTTIGATAMIPPLVISAFPFVARMVESSVKEVDAGVVEAAQSMGASTSQIILKVLLPEAKPSLLTGAAIATTTILGYSAMAGIVGGGGLGSIAINYGYYRRQTDILWVMVIFLSLIVQLFQSIGEKAARRVDKRIR